MKERFLLVLKAIADYVNRMLLMVQTMHVCLTTLAYTIMVEF